MRGQPVLQACLFLVLWMALAVPLWTVTHKKAVVVGKAAHARTNIQTWVTLRFSRTPTSFTLTQDGRTLWQEAVPSGLEFEQIVPLLFDEFGVELDLAASLPDEVAAVEVKLEPEMRREQSRMLWVEGDVDETLIFSWGRRDGM